MIKVKHDELDTKIPQRRNMKLRAPSPNYFCAIIKLMRQKGIRLIDPCFNRITSWAWPS